MNSCKWAAKTITNLLITCKRLGMPLHLFIQSITFTSTTLTSVQIASVVGREGQGQKSEVRFIR